MNKIILVNSSFYDTRTALIEDGVLKELYYQNNFDDFLEGSIVVGKVVRILPELSCAFVNINDSKNAFLSFDDVFWNKQKFNNSNQTTEKNVPLKLGQQLLLQVKKSKKDDKGVKVTTYVSISGRYLALKMGDKSVKFSKKIPIESACRIPLTEALTTSGCHCAQNKLVNPPPCGFIVRTEALGVAIDKILTEKTLLLDIFSKIYKEFANSKKCGCIFKAPSTVFNLFCKYEQDISKVVFDYPASSKLFENELKQFGYDDLSKICVYDIKSHKNMLFDEYCIEDEINKSLNRKYKLNLGAELVFDTTEALTTIDVNSNEELGSNGKVNSSFKINLEAAKEIPRQLRLRRIGGIIVVDFINMFKKEHREQVLAELKKGFMNDPVKVFCSGFSDLGLVEISRERLNSSFLSQVIEVSDCDYALSYKLSPSWQFGELIRAVQKATTKFPKHVIVYITPKMLEFIQDKLSVNVKEKLEQLVGIPLDFKETTIELERMFSIVCE